MSNEFQRIQKGLSVLPQFEAPDVLRGPGDDAAVLGPQGVAVSISADAMVEGIHFSREWSTPQEVGFKLIHSSISDLCAMGAIPWIHILSVAFPQSCSEDWVAGFWAGVAEACGDTGTQVVGGDTTVSPSGIFLSATVLGRQLSGNTLQRNAAQVGDGIYVTGWLGDSGAGLRILQKQGRGEGEELPLIQRHCRPAARVNWGAWLGGNDHIHGCMDVSDGLLQDLGHMAGESGVSMRVFASQVPLSEAYCSWAKGLSYVERVVFAATGGEDYELVFTASPSAKLPETLKGVPLTKIGEVVSPEIPGSYNVHLVDPEGHMIPVSSGGWDPFREKS